MDELIEVLGQAQIEAILRLSAEGVAGTPNPGKKEERRGDRLASNEVLMELANWEMHSYRPERGRRRWEWKNEEQAAVYANRQRIRGERGKRLLRRRGEKIEPGFVHPYGTFGFHRVHLRRHPNILKRLLVHVAAFNLNLLVWELFRQRHATGAAGPSRRSLRPSCSAERGLEAETGPGSSHRRCGSVPSPVRTVTARSLVRYKT